MWHYYIYYRVDPAQVQAAKEAARNVLAHMHSTLQIQGSLRRKCDEANLWMEVYEGIADRQQFESALAEAEQHAGILPTLKTGERRHRECFED